jgi:hypothetical protein
LRVFFLAGKFSGLHAAIALAVYVSSAEVKWMAGVADFTDALPKPHTVLAIDAPLVVAIPRGGDPRSPNAA